MTILTASVWGDKVSVVVDRQISRTTPSGVMVLDSEASKLLVVFCQDAIYSISYTGVAVADCRWLDEAIAECLAFRKLEPAMIQLGAGFILRRPMYETLKNLAFNLPIRLRKTKSVFSTGLTLAVVGWHLSPVLKPFACELIWTPEAGKVGGRMTTNWQQVDRDLRRCPSGLWMQTWGDTGQKFNQRMEQLGLTQGFTHDDVERYIVNAIVERSQETPTVGNQCLALQLDPRDHQGHVQFTYYPSANSEDSSSFLSGWVLTPTAINSPTRESTCGGSYSACGNYVLGGFSDPNSGLFVRNRLPLASKHHGGPQVMSYGVQKRKSPPVL